MRKPFIFGAVLLTPAGAVGKSASLLFNIGSVVPTTSPVDGMASQTLARCIVGSGTTWPLKDTNCVNHSYGTTAFPLVPSIAGGAYLTPEVTQTYLGAGHTGGVQGDLHLVQMRGAAGVGTANRNYVASQFFSSATTSDGGNGVTMGNALGALFGNSSLAVLYSGATNWLNVTGTEVNVQLSSGSSAAYKSGVQIAAMPQDAVQGAAYDAALSISNQAGAIGWRYGILFSAANGTNAVPSGTLLGVMDNPKIDYGIDLTGATISANAFSSNGFSVDGSGNEYARNLTLSTAAPAVNLSDTSGRTDQKSWRVFPSGGSLHVQGKTDAGTFTDAYLLIESAAGIQAHTFSTSTTPGAPVTRMEISNTAVALSVPVVLPSYEVSTLPLCNSILKGGMAYVTDAVAPTYNGSLNGGGAVVIPVFCNGTRWTAH